MATHVFALPDVGEGLTEAEILRWLVRPGDSVVVNQMIVEIETAKAAVELPCPFAGTVEELHVAEGSIVPVGAPIISIAGTSSAPTPARQAVLVGYGVKEDTSPARRRRRGPASRPEEAPAVETPASAAPVVEEAVAPAAAATVEVPRGPVRAKPLVRKLARERGVDLAKVSPTGAQGEVTRADVMAAALSAGARPGARPGAGGDTAGDRVPVRGVQRAMAEAMVQSAFTAPHVTEWVDVDMSRAMEVVARLRERTSGTDVRVTPMLLVAAGLVRAALAHPRINSTWVDTAEGADVVIHREVHLGLAADTPRGLLVPTIRGASGLGLLDLARRIQALIDTARAGRSTPADLTGGTITLTNVGVFGVDGGTPIINPGQTSILAMGRVLDRPWAVGGQVVVRPVMTLSYSFDHRVIDGALGSRALRSVASFLEDPALELLLDRVAD
ncbi:MAG: dihydrolipoamide acetyltransferase family protein [Candidatus Nanopelagicales bacterium]